ncbi:MAG TPA: amidohydrolase family protein [Candidatus Binataceae bacterium]|nr:amidohydrolase family protein [Candidatus Binataceae bacterium]
MQKPIISADSHITEPPGTYVDRIERKYKATAPHVVRDDKMGDVFVVAGIERTIPMGLLAAAGKSAKDLAVGGVKFEEMHRGGWDPEARLGDQDRDGVSAEVIYPTVGMILCNHPDYDYKKACFDAYNLWMAEFCARHPERLIGVGQTAMRSPAEGIEDLRKMKQLGFKGVMMPGNPAVEDYDSAAYDDFYRAAIDLEMPLSFHILTSRNDNMMQARGPRLNGFLAIIRGCQDIIGTFVLGAVFERHPKLKVVCVEADAGWVPHYMYRMDHAYDRHRYWLPAGALSKMPSEYFRENVYVTFQDDWVAFQMTEMCNVRRLMWANDFPHSDSTWPWSQEILKKHTARLSERDKNYILHDNAAELYHLSI